MLIWEILFQSYNKNIYITDNTINFLLNKSLH